jgi:hypothetical protein
MSVEGQNEAVLRKAERPAHLIGELFVAKATKYLTK